MSIKQNQSHDQLYRPFPNQNPQCKSYDGLSLNSNCTCPPCMSRPDRIKQEIVFDKDLEMLRNNRNAKNQKRKSQRSQKNDAGNQNNGKSRNATNTNNNTNSNNNNNPNNNINTNNSNSNRVSDFITFITELQKNSQTALPSLPILDTIIFNLDGTVKFILTYQHPKLKITKLTTNLKTYITETKYKQDLQYQKKKYQRQHMGFSFTQLDHQSQKYIKQFQNNIKFMNPLLNRVAIVKYRNKEQEQILTQSQINNIFVKISRKLYDFCGIQYMQIFPVMYGHEENSYVRKIKYFRDREIHKKNYKIAQHYVGNWSSKNATLQSMQQQFLTSIKNNEQQTLIYHTYKLFIYFQKISNKMVDNALLSFITNDEGNTFYLKNIEYLNLFNLHEVQQRVHQLPKKLQNYNPDHKIDLQKQMKYNFDIFHRNYQRLQRQRKDMELKLEDDVHFSNKVYQSLGNTIPKKNLSVSFVKSIADAHNGVKQGEIQLGEAQAQTMVLYKVLSGFDK